MSSGPNPRPQVSSKSPPSGKAPVAKPVRGGKPPSPTSAAYIHNRMMGGAAPQQLRRPSSLISKDDYLMLRSQFLELESAMKREIATHEADNALYVGKIELLEERLQDMNEELGRLSVSGIHKELETRYKQTLDQLVRDNIQANDQNRSGNRERKALKQQNTDLLKIQTELEAKYKRLQEQSRQEKLHLQREHNDLLSKFNELQKRNEAAQKIAEDLRQAEAKALEEIAAEKRKLANLKRENTTLLDENSELRARLDETFEENKALAQKLHQAREKTLKAEMVQKEAEGAYQANCSIGTGLSSHGTRKTLNNTACDTEVTPLGKKFPHMTLEEYLSSQMVDDPGSDDSFETEIDRILPERVGCVAAKNAVSIAASDAEPSFLEEDEWDTDHPQAVLPIVIDSQESNIPTEGEEEAPTPSEDGSYSPIDDTTPHTPHPVEMHPDFLPSTPEVEVAKVDNKVSQTVQDLIDAIEKVDFHPGNVRNYVLNSAEDRTPKKPKDWKKPPSSPEDESPTKRYVQDDMSEYGEVSEAVEERSGDDYIMPGAPERHYTFPCWTNKVTVPSIPIPGLDRDTWYYRNKDVRSVRPSSSASGVPTVIPFAQFNIPDRFEHIREIRFRDVPKEVVNCKGLFSQVTCGSLEQISYNREAREISVVFLRAFDAREQYIKWFNDLVFVPQGDGYQCSNSPLGHYTTLDMEAFEYGPASRPLPSVMQNAIDNKGVTRVLEMTGKIDHLTADLLMDRVMDMVEEMLGSAPEDPQDVIQTFEFREGKFVQILFTAIAFASRAYRVFPRQRYFEGVSFEYGQDPCDATGRTEMKHPPEEDQAIFDNQIPGFERNFACGTTAMESEDEPKPRTPEQQILSTEQKENISPVGQTPISIGIPEYNAPGTEVSPGRITKDEKEATKALLMQLHERGLVSSALLRTQGLIPEGEAAWAPEDCENELAQKKHWASGELNAIRAYRAGRAVRIVPRSPPKIPDTDTIYTREHYSSRLVYVVGLPRNITYSVFCKFVKGGAVDTIRIIPDSGTAFVIFLKAQDAASYKKYIQAHYPTIDGHRLFVQPPNLKQLSNMRLWDPEKVLREGLSRCIFVEGIPNNTTEEMLRRDLDSINPNVRLEYEDIEVEGVCARIMCTTIAMANFIHDNLALVKRYLGIRVRYEEDYCASHVSLMGLPYKAE